MICELCGKEVAMTHRIEIEGSVLRVGEECRRFGRLLDPLIAPSESQGNGRPNSPGPSLSVPRPRRTEERDLFSDLPEMELAPDWGKRIRVARELRNWTQEELGKRLNEKKSLVLKLEGGSIRPPDTMVRKIEHLLKIRLRADPDATE
jgi:putative transcription factor